MRCTCTSSTRRRRSEPHGCSRLQAALRGTKPGCRPACPLRPRHRPTRHRPAHHRQPCPRFRRLRGCSFRPLRRIRRARPGTPSRRCLPNFRLLPSLLPSPRLHRDRGSNPRLGKHPLRRRPDPRDTPRRPWDCTSFYTCRRCRTHRPDSRLPNRRRCRPQRCTRERGPLSGNENHPDSRDPRCTRARTARTSKPRPPSNHSDGRTISARPSAPSSPRSADSRQAAPSEPAHKTSAQIGRPYARQGSEKTASSARSPTGVKVPSGTAATLLYKTFGDSRPDGSLSKPRRPGSSEERWPNRKTPSGGWRSNSSKR
jgi:hypothetical protein